MSHPNESAPEDVERGAASCQLRFRPLVGHEVAPHAHKGQAVFEKHRKGSDRPAYHQVVALPMLWALADLLGAEGLHPHVAKMELLDGVLQKGRALAGGLDKRVPGGGPGNGQDKAGESAAGAHVGDAVAGGDVPKQKRGQGVEKVLDRDLHGVNDGGEGGASVVGQEKVHVSAIGVQVGRWDLEAEFASALEEGLLPLRHAQRVIPHMRSVRQMWKQTCGRAPVPLKAKLEQEGTRAGGSNRN